MLQLGATGIEGERKEVVADEACVVEGNMAEYKSYLKCITRKRSQSSVTAELPLPY
jgi:hypothetical protein